MADLRRFPLLWSRIENTSILTMPRTEWVSVVGHVGMPVEVDVLSTPLAGVAHVSSVAASVAHQFGPANAKFSIFRYDANDHPTPINHDEYLVWHDLQAHPRLPELLARASIAPTDAFMGYCQENVFFVKQAPGPDHWLPTVPSSIAVLIKPR